MPSYTITISNENLVRANAAAQHDYELNIRQVIIQFVKNLVKRYENKQAASIAEQGVIVPDDFVEIT